MKNILANIIFTKRCPFCGQVILPYNDCCKRCFDILPVIKGSVCSKCGLPFVECSCKRETREYDIVNSRIPMTGDMADLSGWTAVLVLAAVAVMLARGFNLKLEKRADT